MYYNGGEAEGDRRMADSRVEGVYITVRWCSLVMIMLA